MKATFRRQLVVPLALVALTATGCATAHTGRVAGRVGSHTVDTSQVSSYVNDIVGEQQGPVTDANRLSWQRGILTRLIQAQIFQALAAKDHVAVTQADLDSALASVGGQTTVTQGLTKNHIPQSLQPTLITTLALQNKLLDTWLPVSDADLKAAYQQNLVAYQTVNVKFLTVDNQAHAEAIAAKVRVAPDTFDAAAKEIAGPAAQTAETGPQPAAKFGSDLGKLLAAAKLGDVLAVNAQGAWRVLLILSQTTFDDVRPAVLAAARQSTEGPALDEHIKSLLASDPIEVNPRFGKWDEATRKVLDAASDTVRSGPAPGPSSDLTSGLSDGASGGPSPDPAAPDPANPSDQPTP